MSGASHTPLEVGRSASGRATRASTKPASGLGHTAGIPSAFTLLTLAKDFQEMQPGRDLDAALHDLLPEPKVVEPPLYSQSIDAAVGALRSVFPNADWRKFTPISCTVYGASPYNAKAQVPFHSIGANEASQICGGFLTLWASFAQAIEARRAETGTGSVHESAVPQGGAQ